MLAVTNSSFTIPSTFELSVNLTDQPTARSEPMTNQPPILPPIEEAKVTGKEVKANMVTHLVVTPLGETAINWHHCKITLIDGKIYADKFLPQDVNTLLKSINFEITEIAEEDQEDLKGFGLSAKSADEILTKAFSQA